MRVGTSPHGRRRQRKDEDHPHACGDKLCRTPTTADFAGSSPCVWGLVNDRLTNIGNGRIIPMRVGTSATLGDSDTVRVDHPHACGDKV